MKKHKLPFKPFMYLQYGGLVWVSLTLWGNRLFNKFRMCFINNRQSFPIQIVNIQPYNTDVTFEYNKVFWMNDFPDLTLFSEYIVQLLH